MSRRLRPDFTKMKWEQARALVLADFEAGQRRIGKMTSDELAEIEKRAEKAKRSLRKALVSIIFAAEHGAANPDTLQAIKRMAQDALAVEIHGAQGRLKKLAGEA